MLRRICVKCSHEVIESELEEYEYQCLECDEDLYKFETELIEIKEKLIKWRNEKMIEITKYLVENFKGNSDIENLILATNLYCDDYCKFFVEKNNKIIRINNYEDIKAYYTPVEYMYEIHSFLSEQDYFNLNKKKEKEIKLSISKLLKECM